MRPAQSSQILPTPPLVGEPRPELLIGPRIVTPADRTPTVHDPTVLHSSRYAGHTFILRARTDVISASHHECRVAKQGMQTFIAARQSRAVTGEQTYLIL